ncbi:MAG: DUF475 domain-containing protein [Armatimonadetes bacterium]|nr:DUF475 domain-containing protein [Armatimonadota bacterium]
MDVGVIFIVLQLIYLEGILSIDNAAVLAALVSDLPQHEPISWPRGLGWLQRPVHRMLGGQRMAALKVGLLGAYLGRGLMLFAASYIIRNPWLIFLGALYLIKLACEQLGAPPAQDDEAAEMPAVGKGFWAVVVAVELADLAFSLDNVVAAVALSNELWVVMLGVFLGIVTMRFAAGIFVYLVDREPILERAAYILVLNISLELLVERLTGFHFGDAVKFAVSAGTIVVAVAYTRVPILPRIGQRLRWVRPVLYRINQGMVLVLRPVALLAGLLFGGLRAGARLFFPSS